MSLVEKIKRRLVSESAANPSKKVCENFESIESNETIDSIIDSIESMATPCSSPPIPETYESSPFVTIEENLSTSDETLDRFSRIYKDKEIICMMANEISKILFPQLKQIVCDSLKALGTKVAELEKANIDKDKVIERLEDKIDELEQYSRRDAVRINGIPEKPNESTDDLVVLVASAIGLEISSDDINRSHRVGRPSNDSDKTNPRPIIVRFKGYGTKRYFMKNRHKLKQLSSDRSESDKMPLALINSRIYINDDLTKQRATLAFNARQLLKKKMIAGTWCMDGIIFVKTKQSDTPFLIRNEREYNNLLQSIRIKLVIKPKSK